MASDIEAKSFQIVIRLGNTPQFQIAADERSSINPSEMKYRRKGFDTENLEVLRKFVAAVMAAYPAKETATISVEGTSIVDATISA